MVLEAFLQLCKVSKCWGLRGTKHFNGMIPHLWIQSPKKKKVFGEVQKYPVAPGFGLDYEPVQQRQGIHRGWQEISKALQMG